MHIMDKLYARISELKNPTVAGLDTRIEYLPEEFIKEVMPGGINSFEDAAEAVYQYNVRLVDALYEKEKPFILLDDPFTAFDDKKTAAAIKLLKEFAKERQIIYFTCAKSRSI